MAKNPWEETYMTPGQPADTSSEGMPWKRKYEDAPPEDGLVDMKDPLVRGVSKTGQMLKRVAGKAQQFGSELLSEGQKQYFEPVAEMAIGDRSAGAQQLTQNLAPSVKAAPLAFQAVSAVGTGGGSIAANPALINQFVNQAVRFGAGYSAERLGQTMANEKADYGKAVEQGIWNAYGSTAPAAAKESSKEIINFWSNFAKRTGEEVLGLTAAQTTATTAKRSIESGKFTSYKNTKDWADDNLIPMVMAPLGGGARAFGETSEAYAQAAKQTRSEFNQALGLDTITLASVNPRDYAQIEAKMPGVLMDKVVKQYGSFSNAMVKLFGTPIDEAAFAKVANPYVGALAEQKQKLNEAQSVLQKAERDLATAQQTATNPIEIAKRTNDLVTARINALRLDAAQGFYRNTAEQASGVVKGSSEILDGFSESLDKVVKLRGEAGAGLYQNFYKTSGIANNTPLVSGQDILNSINSSLESGVRTGPDAEIAINAVESYIKGRGQPSKLMTIYDASGKPIQIAQPATMLSIDEVRSLRDRMSNAFSGSSPDRLTAQEAIASRIYGAISNTLNTTVDKLATTQGNPGISESWKRAQDYWHNTSQALGDFYGRGLMKPEQRASTFKMLATNIASGDKTAVDSYKRFIDSVATDSKEVAGFGIQAINSAVRDSFIENSIVNGRLDLKKLNSSLSNAAKTGFDTTSIGFGTRTQLDEITSLFDKFTPGSGRSISKDDFASVINSRPVQDALLAGKSVSGPARAQVAGLSLDNMIKRDMLKAKLGLAMENVDNVSRYQGLAKEANRSMDDIRRQVAEMHKDPMFTVFENATLGLPTKMGDSGIGLTRAIMNMDSVDAARSMTALKNKFPKLYPEIESRLITDNLQGLMTASAIPGRQFEVNPNAYLQFFNPVAIRDPKSPVNKLKAAIGEESFSRLEKLMGGMRNLSDREKMSLGVTGGTDLVTAAGLARAQATGAAGSGSLFISAYRKALDLAQDGRYAVMSRLVTDPKFSKIYFNSGGAINLAARTNVGQRIISTLPDDVKKEWYKSSSGSINRKLFNQPSQ